MIRYAFRDGPVLIKAAKDADPQVIGETLASINERSGGRMPPTAVVDAARDEANPLHPHFDWDNEVAGEKWRIEQARSLIRSIVAIEDDDDRPAPAFVSINDNGTAYRAIGEVRSSADLQAKLLAAADRDLQAFQTRYRALKDVCAAVEKARDVVRRRRKATETRAAA